MCCHILKSLVCYYCTHRDIWCSVMLIDQAEENKSAEFHF